MQTDRIAKLQTIHPTLPFAPPSQGLVTLPHGPSRSLISLPPPSPCGFNCTPHGFTLGTIKMQLVMIGEVDVSQTLPY